MFEFVFVFVIVIPTLPRKDQSFLSFVFNLCWGMLSRSENKIMEMRLARLGIERRKSNLGRVKRERGRCCKNVVKEMFKDLCIPQLPNTA